MSPIKIWHLLRGPHCGWPVSTWLPSLYYSLLFAVFKSDFHQIYSGLRLKDEDSTKHWDLGGTYDYFVEPI
jgi:hypothetical protein